ncbi:hypothetical protein LTR85_004809 [Meristemomyces frigidus]|nr:hypothetical protein LTR85_004809 [Meristemomyces frigidus]
MAMTGSDWTAFVPPKDISSTYDGARDGSIADAVSSVSNVTESRDTGHKHDIVIDDYSFWNGECSTTGVFLGVRFESTFLKNARFDDCYFENVKFDGCVFTDTTWGNLVLKDVTFTDCTYEDYVWRGDEVKGDQITEIVTRKSKLIDFVPEETSAKWMEDQQRALAQFSINGEDSRAKQEQRNVYKAAVYRNESGAGDRAASASGNGSVEWLSDEQVARKLQDVFDRKAKKAIDGITRDIAKASVKTDRWKTTSRDQRLDSSGRAMVKVKHPYFDDSDDEKDQFAPTESVTGKPERQSRKEDTAETQAKKDGKTADSSTEPGPKEGPKLDAFGRPVLKHPYFNNDDDDHGKRPAPSDPRVYSFATMKSNSDSEDRPDDDEFFIRNDSDSESE